MPLATRPALACITFDGATRSTCSARASWGSGSCRTRRPRSLRESTTIVAAGRTGARRPSPSSEPTLAVSFGASFTSERGLRGWKVTGQMGLGGGDDSGRTSMERVYFTVRVEPMELATREQALHVAAKITGAVPEARVTIGECEVYEYVPENGNE